MHSSLSPKAQLLALGLTAKRHFGQNFLADAGLCEKVAELCAPSGSSVVELGAGLGALTRPLLSRAAHVTAVERDRDLVPVLRAEFEAEILAERLIVLEADAKAIAPAELLAGRARPHTLCGNLPYQITGPLIELAVRSVESLDRAVFLVQLEVATRLAASPSGDDYGALSVFTQAAYAVERALVIRRGAFYPQPGVDSAVVVLTPRRDRVQETTVFRDLVHGAFQQRRKKLRNAWASLANGDPAALADVARSANIDLDRRGETLSVEEFARMATLLESAR
ncbi:MAG TPA: 16S rRNA (adenine(1518)-N(6)/adenine(1519)-N(6))-dimethyltransferase RsmA [Polyangiaceae bacterium]|nr:16S rRNA (adenine(1518)-N(6)/adenine(1519)-N(6))-dimethyltransferase RsmA [Polyangiaceae bacterium]